MVRAEAEAELAMVMAVRAEDLQEMTAVARRRSSLAPSPRQEEPQRGGEA